ncbi:MAG: RHS repeat-associated core domain-containing protein [Akkermansiaceae bacterium]|nr:RHS repeat-associated core domain-containing protein [Akkermansiaceae bacterium]
MKKQQFSDDLNSLTGVRSSNSGAPVPFDKEAPTDKFEKSWDWEFEVDPLQPGEQAVCRVTLGADDLATLTVDEQEWLKLGPRGQYDGGSFEEQQASFPVEEGKHHAHLDYKNITIPNRDNNVAKLTFDLKVEVLNEQTGSSSSYVPPEIETDPVDNDDEGENDPCGGSSSGTSSSSPNSSSSNPCPNGNNGGDEEDDEEDTSPSSECSDNNGGSASPPTARSLASSSSLWSSASAAGRRVTTQTRKTSMVWRTNFGSFRGMEGVPYGMLEIVAYNFSSKLWTPAALEYLHPMASRIVTPSGSVLGANMAFQIRNGGTSANYYSYAGAASVASIGGSQKRTGSVSMAYAQASGRAVSAASSYAVQMKVRNGGGNTVMYGGPSVSALGMATGYVSQLGTSYTAQDFSKYLDVVRTSDGSIRQIWNLWDGLANVESITDTGYVIAFYVPEQVGTKNSETGLYFVTGTPFKTFAVSGDSETGKLTIAERTEGRAPYITRYWQGTGGAWCMSQGDGEDSIYTIREKRSEGANVWKLITTVQRGENGTPISRVCETYEQGRHGNLCTSRIEAYGTDYARETTYGYNAVGKLIRETAPDGSEKTWTYDAFGRETVRTEPWSGGGDKCTYTYYRDSSQSDPDIIRQYVMLTINAVKLTDTHYTYTEADHVRRVEKRTTALGAEGEQLEVMETWLPSAPNEHARGRLRMRQRVTGVQTICCYEATGQYGALYKVTRETQIEGEAVPGHSTRKITYVSPQGNNTRIEKYALLTDGTWALTDTADYEYDKENRWVKRTRGNGRITEREMMCCGPVWEKDEDGVTTTYSYNTARQLVETIRAAVMDDEKVVTPETIVSYTRDALGRILETRRDIGPMTTTENRKYDLLGQLVSETDVLRRSSTYYYSADGLTEILTAPTGATFITQKHPDGTVLEQSGTGQRHLLYRTECTAEGITRSTLLPQEEGEPLLMEQSVANGWGNVIRTSRANANGGLIHDQLMFDTKNRLLQQGINGMAPTLYDYDSFGNVVRTTLKLAEDPTPANSLVTEYSYACEQKTDGIYRVTATTRYNGQGTTYTEREAMLASSLSSIIAEKSITTDPRSNETRQWTEYTAPSKRTIKAQTPSSSVIAETVVVDGYTISRKDHAGVMTTFSHVYTETGRTEIYTDARGNETTVMFDIAGREISWTDAAGHVTATVYDQATASPSCITDALGNTACYVYDLRGRKAAEYGTAIQPSVFTYDDADRLVALTTFRVSEEAIVTDPRERTDGDVTIWSYDDASGLMMAKTYADGHEETYTYDNWNRLSEKRQARTVDSVGTPLTTTYNYDLQTGHLVSINHNDTTPSIGYTYNHFNLLTQVTDDYGSRTVTWNQYNERESETTAGLVSSELNYQRDGLGRSSGYNLQHGENTVQQTAWGYDGFGRLSTVFLNAVDVPFTYGYNADNGLLETLSYPNTLKRWYTREEKRNFITKIDYLRPGSANYPAKVDYTYDELGRPTEKKDYFNTAVPDLTHNYTYNGRSELIADVMDREGMYSYAYDNIGNRKMAQEGEEASSTTYISNNLNQYSGIIVGEESAFAPEYDEDGNQTKVKTSTGVWKITYNALNQAVSFIQDDKRVECRYDHLNRRVEKTVYDGEVLISRKRFIYQGYLQIAELDADQTSETVDFVLHKTYLWDPMEPVATRILVMSTFDKVGTYEEDLYYTHDLLKNTTALFGIQAGRRALYEYGPYGNIVKMEGNVAEDNLFRFSSEYTDDELGLVYYNYRYYNPMDGRWLGRDPIQEQSDYNLYGYVDNLVTISVDALGQTNSVILYAANSLAAGVARAEILGNLASMGFVGACAEKILQDAVEYNNSHGKGERKTTSKPDGTGNPYKHTRPDPKDSRRILRKNPHTGKEQSEPKPEGYDDWWRKKHKR